MHIILRYDHTYIDTYIHAITCIAACMQAMHTCIQSYTCMYHHQSSSTIVFHVRRDFEIQWIGEKIRNEKPSCDGLAH